MKTDGNLETLWAFRHLLTLFVIGLACVSINEASVATGKVVNEGLFGDAGAQEISVDKDAQDCGRRPLILAPRIKGGHDAAFGAWPWQVTILSFNGSQWLNSCGGSIIGKQWIITAAHCLMRNTDSLKIRAGEHDLGTTEELFAHTERKIKSVFIHHDYSYDPPHDDIALIELDRPLEYSSHVSQICLVPESRVDLTNVPAVATGWGLLNETSFERPNILQEIQTRIRSKEFCSSHLSGYDKSHMLCTESSQDKGVAIGDSGGPLQIEKNGQWFLVGITSIRTSADFFTRVPDYDNWIHEVMYDPIL